jgi:hypothetical protein
VQVQASRRTDRHEPCDPTSIERGVRQHLADKVTGNLAGIWLLLAEHLRLKTWDLLCQWTQQPSERLDPRLALQLVHEAALCSNGVRANRTLHSRGGFELSNGLPFVASDATMHFMLAERTVQDSMSLQLALGKLRRASGDFKGRLLAIDPHRVKSYSKRRMRRHWDKGDQAPLKMAQTFWILDAETHQPVCFTTATATRTAGQAAIELLSMAEEILQPSAGQTLVLADTEHYSAELVDYVQLRPGFDILLPVPNKHYEQKRLRRIPEEQFTPRWAGFATAKLPHRFAKGSGRTCYRFVERSGERPEDWYFRGFISSDDRDEVEAMSTHYPERWHVEEFFNANQDLGWDRAGTMNLNIRYGQMTMALIAQAVLQQLKNRIGAPYSTWDAHHLAQDLFFRLEGDVRVTHGKGDTILVTYYNAPNAEQLRHCYEDLPKKLADEGVNPEIPWLCNFKLDFRFR